MIEVIYKDESQEGQNGEEPFGLPRNIRQIGLATEDYRIYMEDYVYTFLVRLARTEDSLGEAKTRVAVLTGNLKWRSQTAYLFIKGAIIAEEMEAAPDHIDFSENQWKQIQEAQKEYFEDQGDCGMVLFTASASPESIGSDVKSTHETFWRRKSPDAYGTSGKGRCFLPL
ncbi:hypothetical protein M5E86_07690 [Blautia wexlerae]|nr:hypothetical protein M5E86_07690 [Blautia wexlerae]